MMTQFYLNKFIIFIALALFGSCSIASSDTGNELVPLDLSKAGNSASVEIHVSWMRYKLTNGNPTSVALQIVAPGTGQEDLGPKFDQLIESLTGGPYSGPHYDNEIPKPHIGIKVHVVWKDKKTEAILKEQDVYSDYGQGRVRVTGGPSFDLSWFDLHPGDYIVTVSTIVDDPRFDGTFKTGLCAGYTWK